ncbi:hypothetical protein [Actinomadura sp. 3N508]|uniref:hypothetical protein n=1 Tax=Actinomadura sp. 3N508 TaxID=3375153 RepID=UPI0037B0ED07
MLRARILAPVMVAALAVTGCGSAESGGAPAASGQTRVDVSPLRESHHDFEPAASPEALVKTGRHAVIAAGTVEGIQQGGEAPLQAGDEQGLLQVVMKVRVTDEYRVRAAGQVKDGAVYVGLWQGPRYNDANGTPEYTLQEWNKAIPKGTTVMLFLQPQAGGAGVKGAPAGAKIMTPDVQGIIFEDGGRLLGGIEELEGEWKQIGSLAQLKQRVQKQVAKN